MSACFGWGALLCVSNHHQVSSEAASSQGRSFSIGLTGRSPVLRCDFIVVPYDATVLKAALRYRHLLLRQLRGFLYLN